jgi:hypothetical protein
LFNLDIPFEQKDPVIAAEIEQNILEIKPELLKPRRATTVIRPLNLNLTN